MKEKNGKKKKKRKSLRNLTISELENEGPWKDPYGWVVLRLPKRLWSKGQETLLEIKDDIDFNMVTGEISSLSKGEEIKERKIIPKSNIVNVLHHMVDPAIVKPEGFDDVVSLIKKEEKDVKDVKDVKNEKERDSKTPPTKITPPVSSAAPQIKSASVQKGTTSRPASRPKRRVTSDKYRAQYIEQTRG